MGRRRSRRQHDMSARCWKCGSSKPDPIRRPRLVYWLVKVFGYRICRCGGCHRLRLLSLKELTQSGEGPDPVAIDLASRPASGSRLTPPAVAVTARVSAETQRARPPTSSNACPNCGRTDWQRSPRTPEERRLRAGPMARCLVCGQRFPLGP
jgi:hypothetical protein